MPCYRRALSPPSPHFPSWCLECADPRHGHRSGRSSRICRPDARERRAGRRARCAPDPCRRRDPVARAARRIERQQHTPAAGTTRPGRPSAADIAGTGPPPGHLAAAAGAVCHGVGPGAGRRPTAPSQTGLAAGGGPQRLFQQQQRQDRRLRRLSGLRHRGVAHPCPRLQQPAIRLLARLPPPVPLRAGWRLGWQNRHRQERYPRRAVPPAAAARRRRRQPAGPGAHRMPGTTGAGRRQARAAAATGIGRGRQRLHRQPGA